MTDRGGGNFLINEPSDFIFDDKQFMDSHTTAESRFAAIVAAPAMKQRDSLQLRRIHLESFQLLLGGRVRLLAFLAVSTNEALSKNRAHRGGDEERLDAHVEQTCDGAGRVVGV